MLLPVALGLLKVYDVIATCQGAREAYDEGGLPALGKFGVEEATIALLVGSTFKVAGKAVTKTGAYVKRTLNRAGEAGGKHAPGVKGEVKYVKQDGSSPNGHPKSRVVYKTNGVDKTLRPDKNTKAAKTNGTGSNNSHALSPEPKPANNVIERAENVASHERYKTEVRRNMERPHAENQDLTEILEYLHRPTGKVGSGSTAAAVRYEAATKRKVGGASHPQKAEEGIIRLENWLKENPIARSGDRAAAENMLKDLKDALGGK